MSCSLLKGVCISYFSFLLYIQDLSWDEYIYLMEGPDTEIVLSCEQYITNPDEWPYTWHRRDWWVGSDNGTKIDDFRLPLRDFVAHSLFKMPKIFKYNSQDCFFFIQ